MGILEKLRPTPRWKHADPAVRAAAVYEIGADDADALRAYIAHPDHVEASAFLKSVTVQRACVDFEV